MITDIGMELGLACLCLAFLTHGPVHKESHVKTAPLLGMCSTALYLTIQDSLDMLDLGLPALNLGLTHSGLPVEFSPSI